VQYEIEEYQDADGKRPFSTWLQRLKDKRAKARILARLDRVALGNLGDWKALAGTNGVNELRDSYGPGYRVYFSFVNGRIVLLLAGSTKRDQKQTIARAAAALADYRERIGR
jgi:putative addiction module killer protein